jgi:malonyl-CoA decarboxylase
VNVSFLQELLNTIAEQGRQLLPRSLWNDQQDDIEALAKALISSRGEASGVALARRILNRYKVLDAGEKADFFGFLAETMRPDLGGVRQAAENFLTGPNDDSLRQLRAAVESPRQEFFRRLNLAPGATAEIVTMRGELLRQPKADQTLDAVDDDLKHLLYSWFNRGFLVLRRIDWQTPAAILEKIIAYEAVHEIEGWEDLRRRLDPADRRCFAYFHPALIDEPLIFVEVALMRETPRAIETVLKEEAKGEEVPADPTTAVFYSISNCQEGLKGISFGSFLIKQVVEDLVRERPSLKTFVTLSPVPLFSRWLEGLRGNDTDGIINEADRWGLRRLADPAWFEDPQAVNELRQVLLGLAAHYFLRAKLNDGRPIDPVARFHLGNGARLQRLNWLGDPSEKGLREAHGLMVNYSYDVKDIEKNHEAYANDGVVAASRQVRSLLRASEKAKTDTGSRLAMPPRIKSTMISHE